MTPNSKESGTFAHVWWSRTDIEAALIDCDIPNTPENVDLLRNMCDEDDLAGVMIQAGWDYIYGKAMELEGSDSQ